MAKVAITGVAGYTGSYAATRFLNRGWEVLNLTGHPNRSPVDSRVTTALLSDNVSELTAALAGCEVLVNTYWIRFERGNKTYADAIRKTKCLIEAAKNAKVRKIVHISIANPEKGAANKLPYYQGKMQVEELIKSSTVSSSILRPTVIFGKEGILINNITWFLRNLPVFGIPGKGDYKLQPVYVEDLADLIFEQAQNSEDCTVDAVGPEQFQFADLLETLKKATGSKCLLIKMPEILALTAVKAIGAMKDDVIMTQDELAGLKLGLLAVEGPAACPTKLSDWIKENSNWLGTKYFSEVKKHYS